MIYGGRIRQGLILLILFTMSLQTVKAEQEELVQAPYTRFKIPKKCIGYVKQLPNGKQEYIKREYDYAIRYFKHWVTRAKDPNRESLSQLLEYVLSKALRDECRQSMSMAIFGAYAQMSSQIIIEYLLELKDVHERYADRAEQIEVYLRKWSKQRLQQISHPNPSIIDRFDYNSNKTQERIEHILSTLQEKAEETKKPIPYGRFIFAPGGRFPYTAFDYAYSDLGHPLLGADDKLVELDGSYILAVKNWQNAIKGTVKRFDEWAPSAVFGDDSTYRGSMLRRFPWIETKLYPILPDFFAKGVLGWDGKDENKGPTLREAIEEGFRIEMRGHLERAKHLGLPLSPIYDTMKSMERRNINYHKRDLAVFKQMEIFAYSSMMVIPAAVGLKAALGLVGIGASATAATAATTTTVTTAAGTTTVVSTAAAPVGGWVAGGFAAKLTGAAALSSNIAIAPTALLMGGFFVKGLYSAVSRAISGQNKTLGHFADDLVLTTSLALPISVVFTSATASTLTAGHLIYASGAYLVAVGGNLKATFIASGLRGVGMKLLTVPYNLGKAWLFSWPEKNYYLLKHWAQNTAISLGIEITSREFLTLDGVDPILSRDQYGHRIWSLSALNSNAVFSILSGTLMRAISTPLYLKKSFASRFFGYSIISFSSSVATSFILKGEVDTRRLSFDLQYGRTLITSLSEGVRGIEMTIVPPSMGNNVPLARYVFKGMVRLLYNISTGYLKNALLDAYMGNRDFSTFDALKKKIKEYGKINMDRVPNEWFQETFDFFETDPEMSQLLYKDLQLRDLQDSKEK